MSQQALALQRAVRPRILLKYVGQLCLVLSASILVPLSASLYFGDTMVSVRYAIVLSCVATAGMFLARLRAPKHVQANEGMILTALFFLLSPLLATFPMMLTMPTFLDALFEGISAATTTGLSTLETLEHTSSTFLFARAWMQWFGGFGIVALSLAWVIQPGGAAKGLSVTESDADDLIGGTRIHARRTFAVYTALTMIGLLLLWAMGVDFYDGMLYTFSAISTGGFSPHDTSAAGLGWPVQTALIFICLLGAFPLAFYHQLYRHKVRRIRGIRAISLSQPYTVVVSGAVIAGLVWVSLSVHGVVSGSYALHQATFLAFSAQTGAGFSSMDVSALDTASKVSLIPAMIIGGATGSTTGGFKVLRLILLLRFLQLVIMRTCLSRNAVTAVQVEQRRVHDTDIMHALLIIVMFLVIIFFSWLPFVTMGYDPLDALFEVVSALGTVGLSVGITGPDLPDFLKIILCVDMLLGRLEILAWFVLFHPRTWMGRRLEGR